MLLKNVESRNRELTNEKQTHNLTDYYSIVKSQCYINGIIY